MKHVDPDSTVLLQSRWAISNYLDSMIADRGLFKAVSAGVRTLPADPLPLRMDESGTIRVWNTRVTLDLVIEDHQRGLTAQQIAERYTTVELADMHAVLAFYRRHHIEVDSYLEQRGEDAGRFRDTIETTLPPAPTLKELASCRESLSS